MAKFWFSKELAGDFWLLGDFIRVDGTKNHWPAERSGAASQWIVTKFLGCRTLGQVLIFKRVGRRLLTTWRFHPRGWNKVDFFDFGVKVTYIGFIARWILDRSLAFHILLLSSQNQRNTVEKIKAIQCILIFIWLFTIRSVCMCRHCHLAVSSQKVHNVYCTYYTHVCIQLCNVWWTMRNSFQLCNVMLHKLKIYEVAVSYW